MIGIMQKLSIRAVPVLLGVALVIGGSVAYAQKSTNLFRGVWNGELKPEILLGVPEADIERLSQPFKFELRVFTGGRGEIYFYTDNEEFDFRSRDIRITEIGQNGIVLQRLFRSDDGAQNNLSLNMSKVDDNTLLLDWSLLATRDELKFDGLDEIAFAGSTQLQLTGD